MANNFRQGRLGGEIKKIISGMLQSEIKDPRLQGFISVTAVEVTSDGSYATVYVNTLGSGDGGMATEEEKTEILEAFRSAKGLIRKEISKDIKMHHAPDLIFKYDNSLEYGKHISDLIDSINGK